MAEIVVQALDQTNLPDLDHCDGAFVVEAALVIAAEQNTITYTVAPTPPYTKRYPAESVDYTTYLNNPDKAIFLAYLAGQVAGQLRLVRYWNHYSYIEDLVVDRNFRRQGVGRALIEQAQQWTRAKHLPGLMLETQTNNVGACQLYAACGFELGGFDRRLYQGLIPNTTEIALYWYWFCK